jgi:mannitol 2-dehydrogenase
VQLSNAMVDCIVPATGPKELEIAREVSGSRMPQRSPNENFRQWVIEDAAQAARAWGEGGLR